MRGAVIAGATTMVMVGASASAQVVVFDSAWDNGFFTPFNASTAPAVRYGDSGWIGSGASAPEVVTRITLNLAAFSSTSPGFTDLTFTFNDGDPSGLAFGPGTTLYSTTIKDVALPATGVGNVAPVDVVIDLPNIPLSGGFNNFGWSIGVQNFSYAGQLGFTASTASGQFLGFYTSNASSFNGSSWSLFSFGANPNTGVANLRVQLEVPAPSGVAAMGLLALSALRRRRS